MVGWPAVEAALLIFILCFIRGIMVGSCGRFAPYYVGGAGTNAACAASLLSLRASPAPFLIHWHGTPVGRCATLCDTFKRPPACAGNGGTSRAGCRQRARYTFPFHAALLHCRTGTRHLPAFCGQHPFLPSRLPSFATAAAHCSALLPHQLRRCYHPCFWRSRTTCSCARMGWDRTSEYLSALSAFLCYFLAPFRWYACVRHADGLFIVRACGRHDGVSP